MNSSLVDVSAELLEFQESMMKLQQKLINIIKLIPDAELSTAFSRQMEYCSIDYDQKYQSWLAKHSGGF